MTAISGGWPAYSSEGPALSPRKTGNPVAMPWRDKVKAILQAWYLGQARGQAIAEALTGKVNPSASDLVLTGEAPLTARLFGS